MCYVSNAGDWAGKRWAEPWTYPTIPSVPYVEPRTINFPVVIANPDAATSEDIEALRQEVIAVKELLIASKKLDEVTGQSDCEMEEKIAMLKKVAEIVGVSLEEVFGK